MEDAMSRLILLPVVGMMANLFAPAAIAAPASHDGRETQIVTGADLDLGSADGQARLERRIHLAADRLCREDNRASPEGGYLNGACFRVAVAEALKQMQLVIAREKINPMASSIKISRR
jgi:UrcA family protein